MADPNELKAFQDIYEELVRLHEELGLETEDVLKNSDVLEPETLHTIHEEMRTPVIDTRNAAMSSVAVLLNVPNIIARSKPMQIIDADGKAFKSIADLMVMSESMYNKVKDMTPAQS